MAQENMTATQEKISFAELRSAIKGEVITPDDAAYEKARRVFYGKFDRHPTVIVRVANAADVSHVVSLARETGIELAIRSGGHSVAGHSTTEGGILLDLSLMKGLEFDVKNRTAWAEAGLTAGEYTKAAHEHGLATGFGDTAVVGIGGLTTGGGIGYLVRKYGLTIDNLLAVDIVTADGELRRADANTNPDLFWAVRGGGGNFGVVTRFQYKLHEVDNILGGMLVLPATPEVINAFITAADAAPDELSVIVNIMGAAPPMPFLAKEHEGKPVIMALMAYSGDLASGERIIAPFRALGPWADMVKVMPYPEIYTMFGPDMEEGPAQETARTLFFDHMDLSVAEKIVDHLKRATTFAVSQFRVLGGAMARVPADATAFAHRDRRFMAAMGAIYEDAAEIPQHEAWVEAYADALKQGKPGAYSNFVGDEGEARVHEAYPGKTWDRLAKIKAQYDPTNLFRRNQNIPPGSKSA